MTQFTATTHQSAVARPRGPFSLLRRHRRHAAAVAVVVAVVTASWAPSMTVATWTAAERSSARFTAGSVPPVTTLGCLAGLLAPVTFSWAPPSGGLPRTGYRWTVTGGLGGSGALPATATSITLDPGLLGLGSGTFSLYVQESGGWESSAATGGLSFVKVLVNVNSTCSVP